MLTFTILEKVTCVRYIVVSKSVLWLRLNCPQFKLNLHLSYKLDRISGLFTRVVTWPGSLRIRMIYSVL